MRLRTPYRSPVVSWDATSYFSHYTPCFSRELQGKKRIRVRDSLWELGLHLCKGLRVEKLELVDALLVEERVEVVQVLLLQRDRGDGDGRCGIGSLVTCDVVLDGSGTGLDLVKHCGAPCGIGLIISRVFYAPSLVGW